MGKEVVSAHPILIERSLECLVTKFWRRFGGQTYVASPEVLRYSSERISEETRPTCDGP